MKTDNIDKNCFLCATTSKQEYLEVSHKFNGVDEISSIIRKHLAFFDSRIYLNHNSHNLICSTCWQKLFEFHEFYIETENNFLIQENTVPSFNVDQNPDLEDLSNENSNQYDFEDDSCNLYDESVKSPGKESKITQEQLRKIENDDKQIRNYSKMKCELCSIQFQTFHDIRIHFRKSHNQKGYIECCNKKYYERNRIVQHIQVHLDPNSFYCQICNKSYANQRSLENHNILVHLPQEKRQYKCDKCDKSYGKSYQLSQHQMNHMPDSQKQFQCHECNKAFASKCILKHHIRQIHEGAYSLMCDICSKVLKSKATFQAHRREHLNQKEQVKKIQCSLCGSWLKNKKSFKIHMILHEDENKLFVCDICGKQSSNRTALNKHKRYSHLMKRSYNCTLCTKAFKRALNLKEHIATHTGEVLYSCKNSPKTFNSSANYHSHFKKIHKKEWQEAQNMKLTSTSGSIISQIDQHI